MTHLAPVDVECRDELDVAATIAADGLAHDAVERGILAIAVIFDTLDKGACAIANTGNGRFNFLSHRHGTSPCPGLK